MIDKDILIKVLEAREIREERRQRLLSNYKMPVVTISLNIPGPKKDKDCYRPVFDMAWKSFEEEMKRENIKIKYREKNITPLGYEGFILADTEGKKLKIAGLKVEKNHPLGLLFDIDITDRDKKRISRKIFLTPPAPV